MFHRMIPKRLLLLVPEADYVSSDDSYSNNIESILQYRFKHSKKWIPGEKTSVVFMETLGKTLRKIFETVVEIMTNNYASILQYRFKHSKKWIPGEKTSVGFMGTLGKTLRKIFETVVEIMMRWKNRRWILLNPAWSSGSYKKWSAEKTADESSWFRSEDQGPLKSGYIVCWCSDFL